MFKSLKRRVALGAVAAVGAAGLVTIAAPAANAAAPAGTAISATGILRVGQAASGTTVIGYINASVAEATTNVTTDYLHAVLTAAPSTYAGTFKYNGSLNSGSDTVTATAYSSTLGANAGVITLSSATGSVVAGTYNFLVWVNNVSSVEAAPSTGSISTLISVTAGGTPASFTLATASKTVAADTMTSSAASFSVTLKDAAGVQTLLGANETIVTTSSAAMLRPATSSGTYDGSATTVYAGNTAGASLVQGVSGSLKVYAANANSGAATVTFSGAGLLAGGQIPAVNATLNTFEAIASPDVYVDDNQTGFLFHSGTVGGSARTDTYLDGTTAMVGSTYTIATGAVIYVSTAQKTLTLDVTKASSPGKVVVYALTAKDGSTALPAGVSAASGTLTLSSTSLTSYSVTSTGPVAGTGYAVVVGDKAITVVYVAPAAAKIKMGPNYATAAAAQITAAVGTKVSPTATVTDQFGTAFSGALVTFSFVGSNVNRNQATGVTTIATASTGSTGVATFDLTDASTSTTNLKDVLTASAVWAGGSSTLQADPNYGGGGVGTYTTPTLGNLVINWTTATGSAASAVTVALNASGTVQKFSTSGANTTYVATALTPGILVGRRADYKATVTASTGAVIPFVPVSWTISGGTRNGYGTTSATTYTDANGVATLAVIASVTGTLKVTATSGTVSGSDSTLTVVNRNNDGATACTILEVETATANSPGCSDARIITLDKTAYSVTGGTLARVSATVKDRFGNAVSGETVNFALSGAAGRFAGGALTASALTNASGVAVADLAPLTAEAGTATLTASFANGDPIDETVALTLEDGAGTYPAAVKKASATVTLTAGTASATTDAATTSKINDIATAVANLSTTVAGLVASLVAQIKDTKAAIADTKAALDALAAVVAKIQKKVKA